MRAALKRLHSPDVHDLAQFTPTEADKFGLLVQLLVGPAGSDGEESFEVIVCTAKWLAERYRAQSARTLRHHVLVHEFEYNALKSYFEKLIGDCYGESWNDVAARVSRIGRWEFEDYAPTDS